VRSLPQEIARLRTYIDAPLAVGFGISTPEQAHTVAQLADGVVVGSALVRTIAAGPDLATTQKNLEEQARALQSATQKG
jgi:tryptophan synthase alpha chain